MEQTAKKHVYIDKWGGEIDLSVVYGVYKTPFGLRGFFQRCTTYNPVEINEAVQYIIANVHPVPYDQKNARRMMKQIEGSVPSEYKQHLNGLLIVAIIVSFVYIGLLLYSKLALANATGLVNSIDSSGIPAFQSFKNTMSGTLGTLDMMVNVNIMVVTIAMICNAIASGTRKRVWALVAGILYVISLLTFAGNIIFIIALTALSLVAWEQMKDDE